MKTYSNSEVLNKGCEIKVLGTSYKCYNVTDTMHFIKLGKNDIALKPNKSNLMTMSKQQVLRFIEDGSILLTVGELN